jgi:hypothetical protein
VRIRRPICAAALAVLVIAPVRGPLAQEPAKGSTDSAKTAATQDTLAATRAMEARADTIDKQASEWGMWDPGKGFKVASGKSGELNISGYVLFRYLNQLPVTQTYLTHLDAKDTVNTRNDLELQRIMMFFYGWLYDPRLRYTVTLWSVNSTAQVAIGGNLGWVFGKYLSLYGGYQGLPGSRSVVGVFPFFLATDRVLTDEFFRPGFTGGLWANGQIAPGLNYSAMLGNNLSQLGINAAKLNRYLAKSASVWWMPTTGEFGDRGGFGDFDEHTQVATRFGTSYTWSREDRRNDVNVTAPDNTQIRLSDGTLLFQTGTLAPGVTVQWTDFNLSAVDAAVKYNGWFFYVQGYYRRLDRLIATGPLPVAAIVDKGFDFQTAYMLIPKTLMLYGWTSQLFGAFNNSWDAATGVNIYPFRTRNVRLNANAIYVNYSAYGSLFGYYVAGQTGPTLSLAADVFF